MAPARCRPEAEASAQGARTQAQTRAQAQALDRRRGGHIAVLAFDGISAFHLAVPQLVFGEAHPGAPHFDLRLCTERPGPLRMSGGLRWRLDAGLDTLHGAAMVIVPSWHPPEDPRATPSPRLRQALVQADAQGACVVGLCLGAFVLAHAGLLDGLRATTHWRAQGEFAARFPKVQVQAGALFVDEGRRVTSAGTAAGLDCCLHLLQRSFGAAAASAVARDLVLPPLRQGGQAQVIERPVPVLPRDERLGALLTWVQAHLEQPHTLDSLARRALMSRRSFTRHFHQTTGETPRDWLLRLRLGRAQELLEASGLAMPALAARCGFGSPGALRMHFRRAFGMPPQVWRSRRGAPGGRLSG